MFLEKAPRIDAAKPRCFRGCVGAVELEPLDGQPTARAMSIFRDCFDNGVIIRTTGDTLAFSPPLIIEEAQIDTVVESVRTALRNQKV